MRLKMSEEQQKRDEEEDKRLIEQTKKYSVIFMNLNFVASSNSWAKWEKVRRNSSCKVSELFQSIFVWQELLQHSQNWKEIDGPAKIDSNCWLYLQPDARRVQRSSILHQAV